MTSAKFTPAARTAMRTSPAAGTGVGDLPHLQNVGRAVPSDDDLAAVPVAKRQYRRERRDERRVAALAGLVLMN